MLCKQAGVALVRVPYWWDGSTDELIKLIRDVKPDVLQIKRAN